LRFQIGNRFAEAQCDLSLGFVGTQLASCNGVFVTHDDFALGQGQTLRKKG
jgi:hypothetical protein